MTWRAPLRLVIGETPETEHLVDHVEPAPVVAALPIGEMPSWAEDVLTPKELTCRPALRWQKIVDLIPLPTVAYALAIRMQSSADSDKVCESWTAVAKWCVRLRAHKATVHHAHEILEALGLVTFAGKRRGRGGVKVYALSWPSTADVLDRAFVDSVIAPLAELRKHGHGTSPTVRPVPNLPHSEASSVSELASPDDRTCLTVDLNLPHSEARVVMSSSRSSSSGDKSDFESEVWHHFGELKLKRAKNVNNAEAWKRKVVSKAQASHGEMVRRWSIEFDVTAEQIAAAIIDGVPQSWHYQRRKAT